MNKEPLAFRMRPQNLEDFIGQEHVLAKNKLLYNTIKSDRLTSVIIWGPPGCGKTSLAEVISNTTKYKTYKMNAVTSGVNDIKKIIDETQNLFLNPDGKSILFIDEIHRFNKAQQDVLLPSVESGKIILIGTTTENPYFEINKALLSRSMIIKLESLTKENIIQILENAIKSEKGLKEYNVQISKKQLAWIAEISQGDVRQALNGLEIACLSSKINENKKIIITDEVLKASFQEKRQIFDKTGDSHYDTISAFIKSVRGSDENAAIHYLAKALEAGEDPIFLARRLVILAAEDIGLANPFALTIATSAMQAIKMVGMPEARIILSEATIYLAKSKKSNTAYIAIEEALKDVRTKDTGQIPMHIRNAPFEQMKDFEYGVGYKYPHDYKNGIIKQQYLPDKIKDRKYYIDKWGNDKYD